MKRGFALCGALQIACYVEEGKMKKAEFYIELTLGAIVLLSCIFAAYVNTGTDKGNEELQWKLSGISHYRYTLWVTAGPDAIAVGPDRDVIHPTIEVQHGKIIKMIAEDGSVVPPQNYKYYSKYGTINHLFSFLHSKYAREADDVTVEYDPTYGFPAHIRIDPSKDWFDDELHVLVSEFEVLP
jgi:hypothetical protein